MPVWCRPIRRRPPKPSVKGTIRLEFFGGVPSSILYDNTKLAMTRILGDGRRQRTRTFSELQSHCLFADRFGRSGKSNWGKDSKVSQRGSIHFTRHELVRPPGERSVQPTPYSDGVLPLVTSS
jgi:hypothetical protein